MKKIFFVAVNLAMGHSLTCLDKSFAKKCIDNYDNHFQSLCPSLRSSVSNCFQNSKDHLNSLGIVSIDRDDNSFPNDCLSNVQSDCTGSISKFRDFAKNFTEAL